MCMLRTTKVISIPPYRKYIFKKLYKFIVSKTKSYINHLITV